MNSSIKHFLTPQERNLGEFSVRRLLPAKTQQSVGPFIFFDHIGPVTFAPHSGPNVRPHPHIGLAAVTYLFEGALLHRDNTGVVQTIMPHDVNWMTAGSGIVHSERTPPEMLEKTWQFHGIQTWLALPKAYEEAQPNFVHYPAHTLPSIEEPGIHVRVIAGNFYGMQSPIPVFSPTLYADVRLNAQHSITLEHDHPEQAIYVIDGDVFVDNEKIPTCTLTILQEKEMIEVTAKSDSHFLLLGGAPLETKRIIWWNFVASSQEKIDHAKAKWIAQGYPKIEGETDFIPLPQK